MCGLFGIINTQQRQFNYPAFCTMGIANDSRGGDSCGIFIDGEVEYGVQKEKLFEDFFLGSELLEQTKECTIALGHCRKASVGNISLETAQPVVIANETGDIEFVVTHNGTISNYKELAKKYIPDVDIKGMTDSQVMARIFYYTGYAVLDEYIGGAVFVIADYREEEPHVYMFKGASKYSSYSKEAEEERPLFYVSNGTEFLYSSISSSLFALNRTDTVYIFPANYLCEVDGGDIHMVAKYERKGCYQKDNGFSTYFPTKNSIKADYNYYNAWDYDDWDYSTGTTFPDYVDVNLATNTYRANNIPCHGAYNLGQFGFIFDDIKDAKCVTYKVYFWNGIALANYHCYQYLINKLKKSGLKFIDFYNKYLNLIRYLSIDGIFKENNAWYKMVGPNEKELFTGELHPLTIQTVYHIKDGKWDSTSTADAGKNMQALTNQKRKFNFNDLNKTCFVLTK